MGNSKRLDKVIYEINGKDSFVKVKNNSMTIEKVIFSFVKYDTKSTKSLYSGDFYMPFGTCLELYRDIDKGILRKDLLNTLEKAKRENKKYPEPLRQYQGGTPEEKARRNDKLACARIFTIEAGTSNPQTYPYVLRYQEGPGKSDPTSKLIIPLWWKDRNKYKPDFQIIVPCTESDMVKFALLLSAHINGYITACYAGGAYLSEFNTEGKTPVQGQNQTPQNSQNGQNNVQNRQQGSVQNRQTNSPDQMPQGSRQGNVPQRSQSSHQAQRQQAPQQTASHAKPHMVTTPVAKKNSSATTQQNEAGDTSEVRTMKVNFTTAPAYIDGTQGLYCCDISVQNRKLVLYFTDVKYKENKAALMTVYKNKNTVEIHYVIVKEPEDPSAAYTYFMGFAQ